MQVNAISAADSTTVSSANGVNSSTDFDSYLNANDSSLSSIFQKASDTYGVSVSLLTAMAKQESNFQTDVTSKSGAMGIMQLMPATASYLGCSDAYDPEQNIMTGAKYISQLLDKYDGDTSLALAAYNAGSGNVDKYGGIPPFKETQNYVAKITAYMNEGVTLPDGTDVTGSSDAFVPKTSTWEDFDSDTLKEILNKLFSYDDYLKFINLFIKNLAELTGENASPKKTEASTVQPNQTIQVSVSSSNSDMQSSPDSSDYYAFQNINYNNSVLNLLSQNSNDSV